MTALIIFLILVLLVVLVLQIAKVNDLSQKIRGEEDAQLINNKKTGTWLLIFGVVFLVASIWSAYYYKDWMLGYGPLTSASEHGVALDGVFNVTLVFTGIVFVITQFLLFYFAYKYRGTRHRKAKFFSHDNTLEYLWTGIPALAMTFLVVKGLIVWNDVMADVQPDEDVIEIEATGYQFAWDVRHPGLDGVLGEKKFELVSQTNALGIDYTDESSLDDIIMSDIYLPVNKKVRVRITSKDVLHNFYLPHFRVKMDAVPGLPTYFVFTPTVTTEEFRARLRAMPEWQELSNPDDPTEGKMWENFDYELACAELCGQGHFSMRKVVKIVPEIEYEEWLKGQTSYYVSSVRGQYFDPRKGEILKYEIKDRAEEFHSTVNEFMSADTVNQVNIVLDYVYFETGSAVLSDKSMHELDNVIHAMKKYPEMTAVIEGHTDNQGSPESNMTLSQDRAESVRQYLQDNGVGDGRLTSKGYGESRPVESNDTEEGRAMNKRIELRILK